MCDQYPLKKFCNFVLESEKSMDFVAYLLFYCVEIKDKPRGYTLCHFNLTDLNSSQSSMVSVVLSLILSKPYLQNLHSGLN